MKATLRMLASSAALLTLLGGGMMRGDDAKTPKSPDELMKVMAEAGKPGVEHAKLDPLTGSWDYTCKFWLDPSKPPMESKGMIERKWVLGGRFLEEKVRGTGFDGKPGFEGLGLIGYDNGRKKYAFTFASSMGTGTYSGLGTADASGTKFTFETEGYCPVAKAVVQGRDEIRFETSDKNVMESYQIMDGKETKTMEMVSIRKN